MHLNLQCPGDVTRKKDGQMTEARLDPYATLGVARDASAAQIQQAYRRLAKRYHPDLHQVSTTEPMQRLNQAWAILSNPARRARHDSDQSRSATSRADAWSGASRRTTWDARPHQSAGAEREQQRGGPPFLAVVLTVLAVIAVIWLVIGVALFGGLPLPLIGLVLFAVTRNAFRRQF
jgi:hypothetical protein